MKLCNVCQLAGNFILLVSLILHSSETLTLKVNLNNVHWLSCLVFIVFFIVAGQNSLWTVTMFVYFFCTKKSPNVCWTQCIVTSVYFKWWLFFHRYSHSIISDKIHTCNTEGSVCFKGFGGAFMPWN